MIPWSQKFKSSGKACKISFAMEEKQSKRKLKKDMKIGFMNGKGS